MKKYLPIIILALVCICSENVSAMSGSIQITVPKEAEGSIVSYAKVAERQELEENSVAKWLECEMKAQGQAEVDETGVAVLKDVPEGIYQVWIEGKNGYEFTKALIAIPTWEDETKTMNYEISAIPKYTYTPPQKEREIPIPYTGDEQNMGPYIAVAVISFIIVVIISCHNRFKCARMSE